MHYFLVSKRSGYHHLVIYVKNLISSGVLTAANIKIVTLDTDENASFRAFDASIASVSFEQIDDLTLNPQDTLTALSLTNYTSHALRRVVENNYSALDRIHCLITDDEVVRWVNNEKKYGRLTLDAANQIDKSVLWCIANIQSFICQMEPWGTYIQRLTRGNAVIHDALPPFTILPLKQETKIIDTISRSARNQKELAIMVFTKKKAHCSIQTALGLIRKNIWQNLEHDSFRISVWCDPLTRHLFTILQIVLLKITCKRLGKSIKFQFLNEMGAHAYLATVIDHDILLAQDRGGASTIRAFIKSGGTVFFPKGSDNAENFGKMLSMSDISLYGDTLLPLRLGVSANFSIMKKRDILKKTDRESQTILKGLYQ